MPDVSWKSEFDPDLIVERLEACRDTDGSGQVVFRGFEFGEYLTLLNNMLKFPDTVPEAECAKIVRQAVRDVGKKGRISPSRLLEEVNRSSSLYLSQSVSRFVLVTSVSMRYVTSLRKINVDGTIVIPDPHLSPRYQAARMQLIAQASHYLCAEEPTGYLPTRVHVSARSPQEAVDLALSALNLVRGIWNWFHNKKTGLRVSFGKREPVNKVVLGPIHTLHHLDGTLAANVWWYEPNFDGAVGVYHPDQDVEHMYSFLSSIRRKLSLSAYKGELRQAIIRYGLALDDRNWETAFLNLWSVLEDLTATAPGNSYRETIRRTSFIFKDHRYHSEALRCLKDYRNRFVHEAEVAGAIESYLYQLKGYVEALLNFHLMNRYDFTSLKAASEFLDLPPSKENLESRVRLAKSALKFKRYS